MRRCVPEGAGVRLTDNEPLLARAPQQGQGLELRDLRRAIAKLPEEQRSILLLVGLEGCVTTRLRLCSTYRSEPFARGCRVVAKPCAGSWGSLLTKHPTPASAALQPGVSLGLPGASTGRSVLPIEHQVSGHGRSRGRFKKRGRYKPSLISIARQ